MDLAEMAALVILGERDLWGMDELPESIDLDMVRCLDQAGLIEARFVTMSNEGESLPRVPLPDVWFSPFKSPGYMGDWGQVLARRKRDAFHHPPELRVSEIGKAELARMRRAKVHNAVGAQSGMTLSGMSESKQFTVTLRQPVAVAEVARKANMRSDALLERLRARSYPIVGNRRAYMVELAQAILCVPSNKQRQVREWGKKIFAAE